MVWFFLLVLIPFFAGGGEALSLLAQYQDLKPFNESIKEWMPVEKCDPKISHNRRKKPDCYKTAQLEDNPEKMNNLLSATEKHFNTKDPEFLSSYIGREWSSLKNFMKVHESLTDCKDNPALFTEADIASSVDRFTALTAQAGPAEPELYCRADYDSHFISNPKGLKNSLLEDQILDRALSQNIESMILFDLKYEAYDLNNKDYSKKLLHRLCPTLASCPEDDKSFLQSHIHRSISKIKKAVKPQKLDKLAVAKDLNERLSEINSLFKKFNQNKKNLESKWAEEDQQNQIYKNKRYDTAQAQIERARQNELSSLKKEVFEKYRLKFSKLHGQGAGDLFQTKFIRSAMGADSIEDFDPVLLGLLGFNKKVLETNKDFPLLKKISPYDAERAVKEVKTRLHSQFESLMTAKTKKEKKEALYFSDLETKGNPLKVKEKFNKERIKNIENLVMQHPGVIGPLLINNPEHSNALCSVFKNLAKDKRNQHFLEAGIYIGVRGGLIAASILTMGGSLPVTAMVMAAGGGLSALAGYTYHKKQQKKKTDLEEGMINAYLSQTGDKENIDKIREEWTQIKQINYTANVTLGIGIFDLMLIPTVFRAGSVVRSVKQINTFDHQLSQNKTLIKNILKDDQQVKIIRSLHKSYDKEEVGKFLSFAGTLSPEKQKLLMQNLKSVNRKHQLNPKTLEQLAQTNSIRRMMTPKERGAFMQAIKKDYGLGKGESSKLNPLWKPVFGKLTPQEQGVLTTAIAALAEQGLSQMEIARALSNVSPAMGSIPQLEKSVDERARFD